MYHILNHKAPWLFWQKKKKEKKKRKKKLQQQRFFFVVFFFQIDVELIAYDKRSFSKNGWNVIRRYMFKDSKKLATEKKTQQ